MERPDGGPRRPRRATVLAVAGVAAVVVALAVAFASGTRRERAPIRRPPAAPTGQTSVTSAPRTQTEPARPASTGVGPPAQPAPPGEQLGINVNRLFNGGAYGVAQIDAQLRDVAATGATVARSDALWEVIEPRPPVGGVHYYDWSFDDLIAESLAAHGIRWLPLLDYSAPWAESVPGRAHSPPRSAGDFAAFAAALAARYGAGGSFWRSRPDLRAAPATTFEVWNEPDNPSFWTPAPDPGRYADLYRATRNAITDVDPSARVIVGGLSNPGEFLPKLIGALPGLAGHIDGVAIHPYGPDPAAVLAGVRDARQALNGLGLGGVPLYVTEFGWTTRPRGALNYAPADRRGGFIERTVSTLGRTGCGVAAALLYTWITPGRDPGDPQDWYGLRVGGAGGSRVVEQMADGGAFAAGLRRAVAGGASGRSGAAC
jgi:hypothetical protein